MISPAVQLAPDIHGLLFMDRLKRRAEFLKAANAPSWKTRSVIVQARKRGDDAPARSGFTVTKKLGNAVARNRIRRRLREAVRLTSPARFQAGTDYVFIGRQMLQDRPFNLLLQDVDQALEHLNKGETNHQFPRRTPK